MKIKKAAVTGAGGFVASHLVRALLDRGVDVTAHVRYDSVHRNPRLADIWGKLYRVEGDVRHRDAMDRICYLKPDVVFHLAAYHHVGESWRNVEEVFDVNAKGASNVTDVVNGKAKIVFMSTSEVYGRQTVVPWIEDLTPQPNSPYAVTKYAGELHAQMLQRVGHPIVIVRPFNTFGPFQSPKAVIAEIIIKMLHGATIQTTMGEQTREFVYVKDTVDGLIAAAETDEIPEGPVNIAGGKEIKIKKLVRLLHELTGKQSEIKMGALEYRPNEIFRMLADTSKAKKCLGWEASHDFEESLRQTVDWYREHLNEVS